MALGESERKRVLLISDREEEGHRSALEALATLTGCRRRIEREPSLEAAFEGLLTERPAIVALDFGSQPAHAGVELLTALTAFRAHCPVLAIPATSRPGAAWAAMAPSVFSIQDRTARAFERLLEGAEKQIDFYRPVDFLAIAEAGQATLRLNLRTCRIHLSCDLVDGHPTVVSSPGINERRALRLLGFLPVSDAMFNPLEVMGESHERPYEEALELLAIEVSMMELMGESAAPALVGRQGPLLSEEVLENAFAEGIGAVLSDDLSRAEEAFERVIGAVPRDPGARLHLSRLENLKAREHLHGH